MKKIFIMCALAVAAIACQKQDVLTPSELVETSFRVGLPTKTAMDANGGMTWKDSDDLSVFTDTDETDSQTNYQFTIKNLSEDSECAVFNGTVVSNSNRSTIYAIHPYDKNLNEGDLTAKAVTVAYNSGYLTDTYVAKRFIMAGKGNVSGDDFDNATMQMQQLTWVWDITINNPDSKQITAVQLDAGDTKLFPCGGTVDLTSDTPEVVPNFYRKSLQYSFSKVQTGESVLARFPIFPMEANPDVDLDIVVKFEDGTKEVFSRKAPAKATEAGKRYHNTYTLGQGVYDDMPEGWTLVTASDDLKTIITTQMEAEDVSEIKLYLESSATEALSYTFPSSRVNPTKSIYIRSNPENVKPIIVCQAGSTFEITAADLTNLTFSFKNVEFQSATASKSDFIQISNNGVSIDLIEIDNCIFRNYCHSLVRTKGNNVPSGVTFSGTNITSININNSIFRMLAFNDGGGKSFIYSQAEEDNLGTISVTACTFENNALYLLGTQMAKASGEIKVYIHNNTFVNTYGAVNRGRTYFVRFINRVNGTIDISGNLFGGSNNVTPIGLLHANNVTATYSDNYATSDWKSTFEIYSGTTDFLEVTSTNDEVFTDLANFDLTLKSGTTAYGANAGDPRWLPTSSAGLGNLEIEDTDY